MDFNSKYVKTTMDTTADIDVGSHLLVQVPKDMEFSSETTLQKKQRIKREARKRHHDEQQQGKESKDSGGLVAGLGEEEEDENENDQDLDEDDPDT